MIAEPVAPHVPSGDRARVAVRVDVAPAVAFEVFATRIDLWWKRGPRYRSGSGEQGIIAIEPGLHGRVFESLDEGDGQARVIEIGRVYAWEPPHRLAFNWRNVNFAPSEMTDVEVSFVAAAGGTLVTLTHSGWSTLHAGHPARHGLDSVAFAREIGLWWGEQLVSLRRLAGAD